MNEVKVACRREDMSPTGQLRLFKQPDGDIIVAVDVDRTHDGIAFGPPSVEFCSPCGGGGKSPHTLSALRYLFECMERDNRGDPLPIRGPVEEFEREELIKRIEKLQGNINELKRAHGLLLQACEIFEKNSEGAAELWEENRRLKSELEKIKKRGNQ